MQAILRLVGEPGAVEALQQLASSSETGFLRRDIEDIFSKEGVAYPVQLIDGLLSKNLLGFFGQRIGISSYGRRTVLLIEALNGGDIHEIYRKLRRLDGSREMYELVRQRMTTEFFQTFVDRPRFGRLYICSPWINPTKQEAAILKHATIRSEKESGRLPEVLVITRPPDKQPDHEGLGLKPFLEVGATAYFHPRIHSKLYIREPDVHGGVSLAMVGSQNLTRSNMLELGIRINGDTQIIFQLTRYFYDLMNWSTEQS